MKSAIGILGIAAGLTACAPAPAPKPPVTAAAAQVSANEMTIDTLSGGAFRGRAGSAWTEAEIAAQAASLECSGRKPASLSVTPAAGGYNFSGRC